jgi:hypothetical protein
MSIEQTNVVDFISINPRHEVVLTISDHLDWESDNKHLWLLQEKINAYLAFIESPQILEKYPDAKDRKAVISIRAMCEPNGDALKFLAETKGIIEKAGYGFKFEHVPLQEETA